jgi:hypothetical protein
VDTQLPDRLKDAFLGPPTYTSLSPGERLYKMVSIPVVRHRVLESPWWIRQQAFDELRVRARRLRRPLSELVRAQMAVAHEWNPGMDVLWTVVLAAKADAWEGRARSQRVSTRDAQVLFIGGGSQTCVPGLDWRQIAIDYTLGWNVD